MDKSEEKMDKSEEQSQNNFFRSAIKVLRLNKKPSNENLNLLVPEKTIFPEITLDEVAFHDSIDDCWIVIYDRVYNVTDFMRLVSRLIFTYILLSC